MQSEQVCKRGIRRRWFVRQSIVLCEGRGEASSVHGVERPVAHTRNHLPALVEVGEAVIEKFATTAGSSPLRSPRSPRPSASATREARRRAATCQRCRDESECQASLPEVNRFSGSK